MYWRLCTVEQAEMLNIKDLKKAKEPTMTLICTCSD